MLCSNQLSYITEHEIIAKILRALACRQKFLLAILSRPYDAPSPCLLVFEGGFALVYERIHALFLVFGCKQRVEQTALKTHAFA